MRTRPDNSRCGNCGSTGGRWTTICRRWGGDPVRTRNPRFNLGSERENEKEVHIVIDAVRGGGVGAAPVVECPLAGSELAAGRSQPGFLTAPHCLAGAQLDLAQSQVVFSRVQVCLHLFHEVHCYGNRSKQDSRRSTLFSTTGVQISSGNTHLDGLSPYFSVSGYAHLKPGLPASSCCPN